MNKFKLSPKGLELIKRFEGCRLVAYHDSVKVPTIGYGHTETVTDADVFNRKQITAEQAEKLLRIDVAKFERGVNRFANELGVPLKQHQFDALVSFAFNVGLNALRKSTLGKKLYTMSQNDQTSIYAVADQLLRWDKAGGRKLAGLTKRRGAERLLFLGVE